MYVRRAVPSPRASQGAVVVHSLKVDDVSNRRVSLFDARTE